MSVEKVFKCDVGGEFRKREELIRLGVRGLDERPEDADNVDVCAEHRTRPISEVIAIGLDMRRGTADGE